jgi:TBC1 domain family member 16
MSDLLAPVLIEVHNEADSYWCFVNLMQKALFVCTPTDSDMDLNLVNFQVLKRLKLILFDIAESTQRAN